MKAAVKLLTNEYANALKANATPENINEIRASLYRLEAIQSAIKVTASKGVKAHLWLSQKQVRELMATCGDDIVGKRDWIVLALAVGAGLRRQEIVDLTFDDLKEVPRPNGINEMRPVLQVKGKGAKDRVVPIKPILAQRIREWQAMISDDGKIARSLGRKKEITESLSAVGVFNIVRKHGKMIKKDELAPHDLRRTYAHLGYEAGVPIDQISYLLGHSNIAVTQRYLNLDLDLDITISDFIPLNGE